ncbi:hypothetical protein BGW41_000767 [Actinomortierella wolfii]|nr:hypothetical protein BGW41_000767 [Actinomortierella wolfii]
MSVVSTSSSSSVTSTSTSSFSTNTTATTPAASHPTQPPVAQQQEPSSSSSSLLPGRLTASVPVRPSPLSHATTPQASPRDEDDIHSGPEHAPPRTGLSSRRSSQALGSGDLAFSASHASGNQMFRNPSSSQKDVTSTRRRSHQKDEEEIDNEEEEEEEEGQAEYVEEDEDDNEEDEIDDEENDEVVRSHGGSEKPKGRTRNGTTAEEDEDFEGQASPAISQISEVEYEDDDSGVDQLVRDETKDSRHRQNLSGSREEGEISGRSRSAGKKLSVGGGAAIGSLGSSTQFHSIPTSAPSSVPTSPQLGPQRSHHSGPSSSSSTAPRKKITITKDSTPRKWTCKQVAVKTLGGEIIMPLWEEDE